MVDKQSYPQIPSAVWWGVRSLLSRSPQTTLTERTLGVEFNVQGAAAKQYLAELKRIGILNDDGRATDVAQKWRHDESYEDAVDEILARVYPQELIDIAPRGSADRQKIISWFMHAGLGSGTAGNKAATYLLISSSSPSESPAKAATAPQKTSIKESSRRPVASKAPTSPSSSSSSAASAKPSQPTHSSPIPLNINVQIHISADATSEQIEAIFSAMRRYLYDGADN